MTHAFQVMESLLMSRGVKSGVFRKAHRLCSTGYSQATVGKHLEWCFIIAIIVKSLMTLMQTTASLWFKVEWEASLIRKFCQSFHCDNEVEIPPTVTDFSGGEMKCLKKKKEGEREPKEKEKGRDIVQVDPGPAHGIWIRFIFVPSQKSMREFNFTMTWCSQLTLAGLQEEQSILCINQHVYRFELLILCS